MVVVVLFYFRFFFFFETASRSNSSCPGCLKLEAIFLPQPRQCWDYGCAPSHPAFLYIFSRIKSRVHSARQTHFILFSLRPSSALAPRMTSASLTTLSVAEALSLGPLDFFLKELSTCCHPGLPRSLLLLRSSTSRQRLHQSSYSGCAPGRHP